MSALESQATLRFLSIMSVARFGRAWANFGELKRNVLINVAGYTLPLVAATLIIPRLNRDLGTEKFGVVVLIWAAIGYSGMLDMGLGRALTRCVAESLSSDRQSEIPELFWAFLVGIFMLGASIGVALVGSTAWIASNIGRISPDIRNEIPESLIWLGLSIPLAGTTAGLRGFLEAHQRFDYVNAIRIPVGILMYAAPLLVLVFSNRLSSMVAALALTAFVSWLTHLYFCFRLEPLLTHSSKASFASLRRLVRFGGWVAVSNVVGPFMSYMDRFLVAGMVSVSAVAYYSTPYDIVSRVGLIPGALAGVIFPAFTLNFTTRPGEINRMYLHSLICTFLAIFPILWIISIFSNFGLTNWLGPDFASRGGLVLRWFCLGICINGLAQIPYALIQGAGRSDITALFHLAELPVFLIIAWFMIGRFGIGGAAAAWTIRAGVDLFALIAYSERYLLDSICSRLEIYLSFLCGLFLMAVLLLPLSQLFHSVLVILVVSLYGIFLWRNLSYVS